MSDFDSILLVVLLGSNYLWLVAFTSYRYEVRRQIAKMRGDDEL
jgi:hypothetical protein